MADVSELRAIAHPVRLRMLSLLTGTPMSAADLARELGITHANASYHLRQLAAAHQVVEAGEERIRGGRAKLYRYPHEAEAESRLDASTGDRVLYVRTVATEVERRVAERVRSPTGLLADLEGWVEPETWERAAALLREASDLLHGGNRPPHAPGTVHVSFTVWGFRMREEE